MLFFKLSNFAVTDLIKINKKHGVVDGLKDISLELAVQFSNVKTRNKHLKYL